jgi:hypothetical protein
MPGSSAVLTIISLGTSAFGFTYVVGATGGSGLFWICSVSSISYLTYSYTFACSYCTL